MTEPSESSLTAPDSQALLDAVNAVLLPLAQLAVARGLHFSVVEERLKHAFVQAAREARPGGLPHRQVSRISTSTGINRREVTRLVSQDIALPRQKPSLAMRAYYLWCTEEHFRDVDGQPLVLPRSGPSPSFEVLAALVTRDVHARSLLDDMHRLKYAVYDSVADRVVCAPGALIPNDDEAQMLGSLGSNVGDHLQAAVENVQGLDPRHFEKSIRVDGLSEEAMAAVRTLAGAQLRKLMLTLVPQFQKHVAASDASATVAEGEVRVGFYMYSRGKHHDKGDGKP